MEKYVITVTRQFGSMGRPIAKKLAEILDIAYYDRELINITADKLGLPAEEIYKQEEKAAAREFDPDVEVMGRPIWAKSRDLKDDIFEIQKGLIKKFAAEQTCVIVGRCADFVLSDMENAMHIYIYAPYEARLQHTIADLGIDKADAPGVIYRVDEARENYRMQYAGFHSDDKRHKDLMINSSLLGIDGTAEYLAQAVRMKFGA